MANNIVQLTDYDNNNIYPIAGAAAQGSITKTMLDEGVFVGAELSDPGNIAYVGTSNIQDNAVTATKLGIPCPVISENLSEPSSVAYVATDNIQDNAVTSDKIDSTTLERTVYQRNLIGTYIDSNNKKHDLYRIYYVFNDTIAAGGYTAHNVGLADCYIVSTNFSLYRTDVPGVINPSNENEVFTVVFTDNGNWIRFVNKLNVAQNAVAIIGVIECYKRAEQS